MKVLFRWFLGSFLSAVIVTAHADIIDCKRPVKRIFTGYTETTSKIHVEYSDGYAAAAMRMQFIGNDEEVVNRTLGMLLAGHMSGRTLYSRYISGLDGSEPSCTPSTNQALVAVWVE